MTPAPIVFFDIAGPEAEVLRSFYSVVFDWEFDGDMKLSVPARNPLEGAIREDPPEKRMYIGVKNIAATLEDIVKNGGSVDAERSLQEVTGTLSHGVPPPHFRGGVVA